MIPQSSKLVVSVAFCAALWTAPAAVFAKDHRFSPVFQTQVQTLLLENGRLSPQKRDALVARLFQKRTEVVGITANGGMARTSILINKYAGDAKDAKALRAEIEGHEVNIALTDAIQKLQALSATSSQAAVLEAAYNALNIESSIRIEGAMTMEQRLGGVLNAIFSSWTIKKNVPAELEASNLYDSARKEYLSSARIAGLKKQGYDLSQVYPGPSTFWQNVGDISRVDVRAAAMGRTLEMYRGVPVSFPADNVFEIENVKHSDTKPKVDVFVRGADGKKIKFKLKFGAEIHADPTVAALMMALGYPTDVTKYARNITVNLGKMTVDQFVKDWEVYYKRENTRNKFHVENYVSDSGVTKNGDNYIVFKEGLIEAKPRGLDSLGPWAYSENSHSSFREVRALMLIQMWLDNTDSPDFLNNRFTLKKTENGLEKYHLISDPGKALGSIWGSKPEAYSPRMVSANTKDHVKLSFLAMKNGVKGQISFADAKWATRLIAGLTRSQIETAVQLGGWDSCIADMYVNKMISRRNDLVQAFSLVGEKLPSGQTIQLLGFDNSKANGSLNSNCSVDKIAGQYTSDFDMNLGFLLAPIGETTRNLILDGARSAVNSLKKIRIQPDRFDTTGVSTLLDIVIDPRREIERNLNPTSADDQYIVKEHLKIGLRSGIKYGAYIDNTYTIAFSLAFPVRSLEEARTHKGFVVNALLPRDILKNQLPPKYVLLTEHSFSFGAGVNIDQLVTGTPLTVRAGAGEVTLHRSILDHRDANDVIFYRENSKFNRATFEALFGLAIFKIPIFKALDDSRGRAAGKGFTLTSAQLQGRMSDLLKSIVNGEFSQFRDLEEDFDLKNRFSAKTRNWNLILVRGGSSRRMDNIILDQADQTRAYTQYQLQTSRSSKLLGKSETRKVSVEVYSSPSLQGQYQINFSVLGLDKNTVDRELSSFVQFVNGLGSFSGPVIPFSPELGYSKNGRWGHVVLASDIIYYPTAVAKIATMSNEQYLNSLAAALGKSRKGLTELQASVRQMKKLVRRQSGGVVTAATARRNLMKEMNLTVEDVKLVEGVDNFLKELAELRKEKVADKRIKQLAELMRRSVFTDGQGFYNSQILGALNHLVGESNFYSLNTIANAAFTEANMIEDRPLVGEIGRKQNSSLEYLVFSPVTPTDLYFMFDSWF